MEYVDQIIQGDCIQLNAELPDASIGACICSPPYAEQRVKLYGGIPENEYPDWTVRWMRPLKTKLVDDGSVFIVIRPHISEGQISDYVYRTILAVRADGWRECEQLIWYKPDAPPLGSTKRPRRAWESILWFSMSDNPYCDLKACGNKKSVRVGGFAGSDRFGQGGDSPIAAQQNRNLTSGTSRCTDVITVAIGTMDKNVMHPAMYPRGIPEFLIKTFSQEGQVVLDPFVGSGQTPIEAANALRHYVGFDCSEVFVEIAKRRIAEAVAKMSDKNIDLQS